MTPPAPRLAVHRDDNAPPFPVVGPVVLVSDEIFDIDAAAKFFADSSVSWLQRSDVPRAKIGGRVVFLRSQLIAYVVARLTHRIDLPVRS